MKFAVSSYSLGGLVRRGEVTEKGLITVAKELGFDGIEFAEIHPADGQDKIEYAKLMRDKKIDWYEFEYIITNSVFPFAYYLQIMQPNKESIEKTIKAQKERCLKYPELYCNGVYDNYYDYKVKCNSFFDSESNDYNLKVLADVLGAEALNDFLGYRFDVVKEYFEKNIF